jgi:MFS family permease
MPAGPPQFLRLIATVFLPFAGGYFLSYLYRSTNAIIAPQLVTEIGLSASDLGLLTSAYFFAFAAVQLPLGVLLDRFGPRRVQSALLVFAALGAVVFAGGENKEILAFGRALIGLGVAGSLMSSFKAITIWFPERRWPLINGCFMAMGGLGAVSATVPLEAALQFTDWRGIFYALAAVTLCVAVVIFICVPEKLGMAQSSSLRHQFLELRKIYGDRVFWRFAPITAAALAVNMSVQSLWAGLWLRDIAGLSRSAIATYLLVLSVTMTIGFVLSGALTDLLERRGIRLAHVLGWGTAVFLCVQAVIVLRLDPVALWPWVVFGLSMYFPILSFTQLTRHFSAAHTGRAITGLNLLIFSAVFITQYATGAIIDLWSLNADGGYQAIAYSAAFGFFLIVQIIAFAWFLIPATGVRDQTR